MGDLNSELIDENNTLFVALRCLGEDCVRRLYRAKDDFLGIDERGTYEARVKFVFNFSPNREKEKKK